MKILYKMFIAGALITLTACETDFDNNVTKGYYSNGDADFSKFISVGNSLTAGYADNALYTSGQNYSFPNILASRFEFAGGGEFTQPMMADNIGGLLLGGVKIAEPRMVLSFNPDGSANPSVLKREPTTEVSTHLAGGFNNLGVPGAKSYHLVANGYGNLAGVATGQANPYYARFASNANASVLQDAMEMEATFYSLWIGNNDILGYASSGGVGKNQAGNVNPATYGGNDITDPGVFHSVYENLLKGLSKGGAVKGVVANLPDVTTIPYFNTVPLKPIPLDAVTAATVNTVFKSYNDVLPLLAQMGVITAQEAGLRNVAFVAGQNAPIIKDKDLTDLTETLKSLGVDAQTAALVGQLRQANAEDLILLPASGVLGTLADPSNPLSVMGVAVPLGDHLVLTKKEQEQVHTAMLSFNNSIKALAAEYGAAFVDANAIMTELHQGGIAFDGGVVTSAYVTGGAFSLDGVHPSPRGYAYLANQMIKAIETKYNADLPVVNIGEFPTVTPQQNQ